MLCPSGRFPPAQRIRKRAEYQDIQRSARRVSTPCFVLLVYARAGSDGARLGIVASRKVGNAVARNRAKRLVREAFRTKRELFDADIDVIVIVKRAPAELGLADVVLEWEKASASIRGRSADARSDRERRAARQALP